MSWRREPSIDPSALLVVVADGFVYRWCSHCLVACEPGVPFDRGVSFVRSLSTRARGVDRSIARGFRARQPDKPVSQPGGQPARSMPRHATRNSVLRLFRGEPAVATAGAGRRTRSSRMLRQAGRRDARGAVVRAPRNNTRTNRDVSVTDCIFAAVGGRPCSTSSENLPARMGGRSCTCRAVDPH
jgi:hypothetical protein